MEPSFDGPHELERHVESQMRAQERQLAWVRLGMAALAGVFLAVLASHLRAAPVLAGVAAALGVWSLAVPWLLHRFPAREVGIISTVIDMAAVTVAVYVASDAVDVYLFYGLVILGTALRFGLGASVWSSIVMSALYVAVVILGGGVDRAALELLPIRVGYLVGFGIVAGLFSRVVIGRATENARLQQRLAKDEREREQIREREQLSRLGRDFGSSLDREATLRTVADGAGQLLGGATAVFTIDDAAGRLTPAAAAGPDAELVERWLAHGRARRPRIGEGVVGAVAATAASRDASAAEIPTSDPDGMGELEIAWLVA